MWQQMKTILFVGAPSKEQKVEAMMYFCRTFVAAVACNMKVFNRNLPS
jgi:hypothetical protein